MSLKKFLYECGTHISCVQNRLFISSECPFHTLGSGLVYFQVYIIIFIFFMATKVNRSTKSDFFLQISKNHNKKTDNQKKKLISPLPPT